MLADPSVPDTIGLVAAHPSLVDAPVRLVPGLAGVSNPRRYRVALFAGEAVVAGALALLIGRASSVGALFAMAAIVHLAAVHAAPLPLQTSARAEVRPPIALATVLTAGVAVAAAFVHVPIAIWVTPAAVAVGIIASRSAGYAAIREARRTGRLVERAVVVGHPRRVAEVVEAIRRHPELGLTTSGTSLLDLTAHQPLVTVDVLDLSHQLAIGALQRVIVAPAPGPVTDRTLSEVIDVSRAHAVATYVAMPYPAGTISPPAQDAIDRVRLQRFPRRRRGTWRLKRPFDVALSVLMLLLLAPVLLVVAIAVRLSSRGPVLYRQKRLGQRGRVIDVLKFRTFPASSVNDDEEQWVEEAGGWTVKALESPLRFGRWLRRTSIDELPQLWNVIRGEMSLIGPRPERPHIAETLSDMVHGYVDRHRFPVGLTGLAQVNGLWGSTSIEQRVVFDNYYIEHWSMAQDLRILARTIPEVLRRARVR
ncbi:MAG TPA: sugar transferase [Acidimicrobiales bacterium]|nr:sugar transferase [Acidimicrobiales bacterium]